MTQGLERAAPAKVNLALHVTGRRADGYHLLESLVVFARHGDTLQVTGAQRDGFSVCGPFAAEVPRGQGNLVLRARDLLRRHFGALPPVALTLRKNLPVASGIGGGSSDAAATLSLLCAFWHLPADASLLGRLAVSLGADVPMCLLARPLLARGIGETVEPLAHMPALPLLLVNSGQPLATPDVFAALGRRDNPPLPPFTGGSSAVEIARWLAATRNDLEAPALTLLPAIGAVLEALRGEGALLARMSGSGATCFGIFESPERAQAAANAIASRHARWFVQATTTLSSTEATAHD